MSTEDRLGNLHDAKGLFTEKHNTAPGGSARLGPPSEFENMNEPSCSECGGDVAPDPDGSYGVYVHLNEDGERDYDIDEDHVAVPWDDSDETGEQLDDDDPPLVTFQAPGSSSTYEIRVNLDDSDHGDSYELYRDGTYVVELNFDGWSSLTDDEKADGAKAAALAFLANGPGAPTDADRAYARRIEQLRLIGSIQDTDHRDACTAYLNSTSPSPTSFDYTPSEDGWGPVNARDIEIGDRLTVDSRIAGNGPGFYGRIVTHVEKRNGEVYVWCDADAPASKASVILGHGDPVQIHDERPDLSDPDWFEVESRRVFTNLVLDESDHRGTGLDEAEMDEFHEHVRYRLYKTYSGSDISPLHPGGNDPRLAQGRAKVGDDVIFEQPMHGSDAYRVIGKRHRVDVLGHDGTKAIMGETGEVEYVIQDLTTGYQSTSNLRGVGWRRVPAPGDDGPGAQAAAASMTGRA